MNDPEIHCETRQCRAIFPGSLNANDTLFGGLLMKWMDEVAFLTATRYSRQRMFTVSVDNLKFSKTICPDSMVELIGFVVKAGPVRLRVKVEAYTEEFYSNARELAAEAVFNLAAVNEAGHPVRLIKSKNADPSK